MRSFLILLIRLYRSIFSPFIGQQCRFYPTCSRYGEESIQKYGSILGTLLTFYRIIRCGPWSRGGYDPVPEFKRGLQK